MTQYLDICEFDNKDNQNFVSNAKSSKRINLEDFCIGCPNPYLNKTFDLNIKNFEIRLRTFCGFSRGLNLYFAINCLNNVGQTKIKTKTYNKKKCIYADVLQENNIIYFVVNTSSERQIIIIREHNNNIIFEDLFLEPVPTENNILQIHNNLLYTLSKNENNLVLEILDCYSKKSKRYHNYINYNNVKIPKFLDSKLFDNNSYGIKICENRVCFKNGYDEKEPITVFNTRNIVEMNTIDKFKNVIIINS